MFKENRRRAGWLGSTARRPLMFAASLGAALAIAGAAAAAEPSLVELDAVVVTAQKRVEDVSKVPVTVQALGGEALERQGVDNLQRVIDLVPNASLAGESSQGTEVYQLRGVAVGDTVGDATVASYLDDFAYSIPGSPYAPPADLYDLNRVEVLKGPQGTLYGSSSLGGVLKIVTNDPVLDDFHASAQGSVGAVWDHAYNYSGDFMVNAPIVKDVLGVRLVLSGKHLSGFSTVPFLGLENANKSDTVLGRLKVLFEPNDRLSVLASVWRFEVDQDFTNRLDDNDPPTDIGYAPGNSPTDYTLYTLRVNYDLGWADLTSASGYIKRHYGIDLTGCQIELCYNLDTTNDTDAFHQEIRLSSKGDGALRWIAGLFYLDSNAGAVTDFDVTPPLVFSPTQSPPINTQSNSAIASREIAGFGEISYDLFGGKLRPLLGLRYSAVERKRREVSLTRLSGAVIADVNERAGGSSYHISPRFNLSYFPNDDGMLYVNVAEGYRPGALQTRNQVVSLEAVLGVRTSEQLQTDSLWSYEVGAKWAFLERSLNVSVAAYMIKWDRAQLQTGLSGVSGILNVGDVDGKGIEVFISHRTPIEGLRWQFAGGWNSTKLKQIDPNILQGLSFLRNGMQLPPVPKLNATFQFSYERPIDYFDATFLADASYTFRSNERDLSTGRVADKLNTINASIGFRKNDYTFQFFADNITNEDGPSIWEQGRIIMPRPRTLGVRFAVDAF